MQFSAKARKIKCSPFKLRPLVDVIRGKNAAYALGVLASVSLRKALPVEKLLRSAVANAKNLQNLEADVLRIKDIRVDQGPSYRYLKPGAMGRASVKKRRFSHISVVLESTIEDKKD